MTAQAITEQQARDDRLRRALDLLLAGVMLVLVIPVILMTAIGSAISLRAWPFFSQERIGRDGEPFHFLKVRTLRPEVPQYASKRQLDADRIPPFCQLLRRLHLDELPQLLLVVRGHMSLIGPRPEMAHLHEQFPAEFARQRTSVRPGCTGLWQVSTACTGLIVEAPYYDEFYLQHRSLRLDLWVLGRTALNMIGLSQGLTLDDVPDYVLARPRATDRGELLEPARVLVGQRR